MVTIVDPHIKRDAAWPLFKEAEEKGLYVKNREGADFDGCAAWLAWLPACWVDGEVGFDGLMGALLAWLPACRVCMCVGG